MSGYTYRRGYETGWETAEAGVSKEEAFPCISSDDDFCRGYQNGYDECIEEMEDES